MATFVSKFGEPVEVINGLFVAVLEVHGRCVSFGVWDTRLQIPGTGLSERIADVCRNRSTYFWFPKNGVCTLVVHAEQGKEMFLVGTGRLYVLDVKNEWGTYVVTGQSGNLKPNVAATRLRNSRSSPRVETNWGDEAEALQWRSKSHAFKESASR